VDKVLTTPWTGGGEPVDDTVLNQAVKVDEPTGKAPLGFSRARFGGVSSTSGLGA
jgi:hypothetical protein